MVCDGVRCGIMTNMKRAYGFTIVELLIVIVVIGILAAISIVAYGSISTKAENTKTVQGVSQYVKAIHSYAALNSAYPIVTYACLGPTGTSCARVTGSTVCLGVGAVLAAPSFDTAIKEVINGDLPKLSAQKMPCAENELSGGFYRSADGKMAQIYYFLKGDQPCESIGGVQSVSRAQQDGATRCLLTLPIRT